MKLSKLREEENEPVNGADDKIKQLKFASDKFIQTIHKFKKQNLFWKTIEIPEGTIRCSIRLEDIPFTVERYKEGFLGEVICSIDFVVKMNEKPEIPLNILQVTVGSFMDELLEINPDLKNKPSIYPPNLLDMYHFKIQYVTVYPGQGILHLRDYMDTPTFNLKIQSPNGFGGLLLARSYMLNTYSLTQGDLPIFADNYSLAMEKLVKKAKSVYHGLKKGTWKGHTYELYTPHDWKSAFVVHQDKFDYNRTDKVLRPNFNITCNFGYEIVDGIKNSPEDSPLSEGERAEFREYLKKRFQHFDITY